MRFVAVEAMKERAFDYLIKPFGKDDVLRAVNKALTLRAVLVENLAMQHPRSNLRGIRRKNAVL